MPRIEQDGKHVYIYVDSKRAWEAFEGMREGYRALGLNPQEITLEYFPNNEARVVFPMADERAGSSFINGLLASLADWGGLWQEKALH